MTTPQLGKHAHAFLRLAKTAEQRSELLTLGLRVDKARAANRGVQLKLELRCDCDDVFFARAVLPRMDGASPALLRTPQPSAAKKHKAEHGDTPSSGSAGTGGSSNSGTSGGTGSSTAGEPTGV